LEEIRSQQIADGRKETDHIHNFFWSSAIYLFCNKKRAKMTKQKFTLQDWQATFKPESSLEMPKAPVKKDTDEFGARIDGIIADAQRLGIRTYQSKIQTTLYQLDRVCASVANELMRQHCCDNLYQSFCEAWDELKRMIGEIENNGGNHDQTN
jgi:hypothetical protein